MFRCKLCLSSLIYTSRVPGPAKIYSHCYLDLYKTLKMFRDEYPEQDSLEVEAPCSKFWSILYSEDVYDATV